jgi:hypothetical protein
LKKYLHEHPDADKSKHHVKKQDGKGTNSPKGDHKKVFSDTAATVGKFLKGIGRIDEDNDPWTWTSGNGIKTHSISITLDKTQDRKLTPDLEKYQHDMMAKVTKEIEKQLGGNAEQYEVYVHLDNPRTNNIMVNISPLDQKPKRWKGGPSKTASNTKLEVDERRWDHFRVVYPDPYGQTYDSYIIDSRNPKTVVKLAQQAMEQWRRANQSSNNYSDLIDFMNGYVKEKTGGKWDYVRWNMKSYPD